MRKEYSAGSSRVQSNLLQQNCFVRDVTVKTSIDGAVSSPKTFLSLDEETNQGGVKIVEKVNDYPITPHYVASFADSVDYRKDPFGNLQAPRQNLGDVTAYQKVSSLDTEEAFALYNQLKERFSQVKSAQANSDVKVLDKEVESNV